MDPLPAAAVTIAERLKGAGYRTGAIVGSVVLDQSYGLAQGFDDYDDAIAAEPRATMAMADLQRTAGAVTAAARKWIAQSASALVPLGALLRSASPVFGSGEVCCRLRQAVCTTRRSRTSTRSSARS